MENNKLQPIEAKPVDLVVDPHQAIASAERAAKALLSKIKPLQIKEKKYLTFEHLQTIGRFYGYTTGVEWSKPSYNKAGNYVGYEARAVVYHKGVIVSAAEAICSISEQNWRNSDQYAVKSMAQTRACAKSLRNVIAWVAVIAGYEATPAEEMSQREEVTGKCPHCFATSGHAPTCPERGQTSTAANVKEGSNISPHLATEKQRKMFFAVTKANFSTSEEAKDMAKERFKLKSFNDISKDQISELIDKFNP